MVPIIPANNSGIPATIPFHFKKWPDSIGIEGRFQSEQVAGFFRNHRPDFVGIRS
jgi:hypothetical protein